MRIFGLFALAILLALTTACSHHKSYLVSIYQIEDEHQSALNHYYHGTQHLLAQNNGRYLEAPLMIDEDLPNSAQPALTESFPGNAVLIAEFASKTDLKRFVENPRVNQEMDSMAQHDKDSSVFIAREFNPMGMMPPSPKLGALAYREDPAFIMVNAFSFKTLLNPLNPYRIMKYMRSNMPELEKAEVKLLMPFEKVQDVRGHYGYQALFFTEWASKQSFDAFHRQARFVDLAKRTRNKGVKGFTESKASVQAWESMALPPSENRVQRIR